MTEHRLLYFWIGAFLPAWGFWAFDHDWFWPLTLVGGVDLSEIAWRAWHYR